MDTKTFTARLRSLSYNITDLRSTPTGFVGRMKTFGVMPGESKEDVRNIRALVKEFGAKIRVTQDGMGRAEYFIITTS